MATLKIFRLKQFFKIAIKIETINTQNKKKNK